jgi:hypothetical protein
MPLVPRLVLGLLTLPVLALSACKSSETKSDAPAAATASTAEISNEFTVAAQVVAVRPGERGLTLKREDGSQFDVNVAESVRNYDQIAAGDALRVRYRERLSAELRPAGEKLGPVETDVVAARAKPGLKPGAGLGMSLRVRVKVESIDLAHDLVVFSIGSGELIARRLKTDKGREFVKGLEVGDIVQLEYIEVAAVAIEKP